MKKILALFTISLAISACTTDSYEVGDNDLSYMHVDFADVYTDNEAKVVSAMTDEGDSLVFSEPAKYDWAAKKDSVYRTLLYYNKVKGRVEPSSLSPVPVLNIMMRSTMKEPMAAHPVKLESVWRSTNGRYLNLGIALKMGNVDAEDLKQSVGMVCDTIIARQDGVRELHLQLFHNQNNMPEYYSAPIYVCISLSRLSTILRKGDEIYLKVNTYDGMQEKRFVY